MQQRLSAVTFDLDIGILEDPRHLVAQVRDVLRTLVIGDRGEQADEAPFTYGVAIVVIDLDTDIVEERRAMHSRTGVGLGQDKPVAGGSLFLHFRRELGPGASLIVVAQDAEARARHILEEGVLATPGESVLTVSKESEVIVGKPFE